MSNMYSLLNYIAATNQDVMEGSGSNSIGTSPYIHTSDEPNLYSVEIGLGTYSEEEKRLIGISTISVVTRLALEFQVEEVIALAPALCDSNGTAEPCAGHSFNHFDALATH